MNEETELVDVTVTPDPDPTPGRGRMIAGGLVVVAALVAGGIFVAGQRDSASEVAVAEAAEDETVEQESSSARDSASSEVEEDAQDSVEAAASEAAVGDVVDFASDSAVGFGLGGSEVVFADGEFVSLKVGPEGIAVSRSTNGTDWSSQPATGLPQGAQAYRLARTDSGWITVVEIWPEFDEVEPTVFVGPGPQPERLLGFSEDLVTWTTSEFPGPDLEEGESSYIQGLAAAGDRVALLLEVQPVHRDELQILFEEGYLNEADLENYCGGGFEGDDYVAYTCDFGAFEEEVIENEAIEAEILEGDDAVSTTVVPRLSDDRVEEEELLRVRPGDPGYAEIEEIFNSFEEFEMPPSVVLAGSFGGEFTETELPAIGYNTGIASTDSGFVVLVNSSESGAPVILSSSDGTTWGESGGLGSDIHINSITGSGDRLVALGQNGSSEGDVPGVSIWASDDLGATWNPGDLDSALFGPYGMPIAGPAGFALQLEGATEPYEDNYEDPLAGIESVDVEVDGYTMTIFLESGFASLSGPDGAVIHERVSEELMDNGGADDIIRFEGRFDETLVWLDPETGEDLVSITGEDIDEVFNEFFAQEDFDLDGDFMEPARAKELWFSADGISWTLLQTEEVSFEGQEANSSLAGVGDDEVLTRNETFVEPPAELLAFEDELREPTDEEIAALDAWFAESQQDNVSWVAVPVG